MVFVLSTCTSGSSAARMALNGLVATASARMALNGLVAKISGCKDRNLRVFTVVSMSAGDGPSDEVPDWKAGLFLAAQTLWQVALVQILRKSMMFGGFSRNTSSTRRTLVFACE